MIDARKTLEASFATAFVFAAYLALPLPVEAQACALLRPGTPEGSPMAEDPVLRDVAEAVQAELRSSGLTVTGPEVTRRRLAGQPQADCNALDCGGDVAERLGVDFTVLITVWAPQGRPSSVALALIGPENSVAGDAPVESGDLVSAATRALRTAYARWRESQRGFLLASSTPRGATVEVDGEVVGQTPLRRLLGTGERRVRVRLEGYTPAERVVVVQRSAQQAIDVVLVPSRALADAAATAPTQEISWWNWVLGGGLTAAGVGLLVAPIHGAVVHGTCADEPPCRRLHEFGAANGVLLGVAAAALTAGIVVLAWRPLRVRVEASPASAALRLRGEF